MQLYLYKPKIIDNCKHHQPMHSHLFIFGFDKEIVNIVTILMAPHHDQKREDFEGKKQGHLLSLKKACRCVKKPLCPAQKEVFC